MGSAAGVEKGAARRLGLTLEQYRAKLAGGRKWCTACSAWRPVTSFGVDRSRGDGRSARCELHCRRTDAPGKPERAQMAALGLAWCRDCRWWLPMADVDRGQCAPHRRADERARYTGALRQYRLERAAARRGVGVAPAWWREHQLAMGCAYCDARADTLDHVVPVARGGITHPQNLVPACTPCNSRKRDGDPGPWIALMDPEQYDRIASGGLTDPFLLWDEVDELV